MVDPYSTGTDATRAGNTWTPLVSEQAEHENANFDWCCPTAHQHCCNGRERFSETRPAQLPSPPCKKQPDETNRGIRDENTKSAPLTIPLAARQHRDGQTHTHRGEAFLSNARSNNVSSPRTCFVVPGEGHALDAGLQEQAGTE